jgi:carbon-monoxide dehydrogenase medium subunit
MYAFDYHRPSSVSDATALLRDRPEAKLVSGGQTLIPTLKQRLASPSDLIDLSRLPELKGIADAGGVLSIGAAETHAAVAASALVQEKLPALARLAAHIGDPHVRHRGTIGGSVANNDPAADYPSAVLALGATVHTATRAIAADDFFTGMFSTALEADEILTRISFPLPTKAAYVKFPNPASRYAMVGVFVAVSGGAVRVAVTGAAPCVHRWTAAEEALTRSFTVEALDGLTVSPDEMNGDMHGSAEYRAHLVGVITRRAVAAAAA